MRNTTTRNSIFCILPPHILDAIVKNGTADERAVAVDTLSLDHSTRSARLTASLMCPPG